jgi:hypothetical protein
VKTPSYIPSPLAPTQVTGDRDTSQRHVLGAFALKKAENQDIVLVMGLRLVGAGSYGKKRCSLAGIRTRVSRVRAAYPNQLDYEG